MTYDPAFTNTAACRSRITFIDGDKGILLYRGYPIEQLAEHSDLPRNRLPGAVRRTAGQGAAGGVDQRHQQPHGGARGPEEDRSKGSATTRIRWACS